MAWYRRLIAKKFDGSKHRRYPGRPPIEPKLQELTASSWQRGSVSRKNLTPQVPKGAARLEKDQLLPIWR